MWSSTILIYSLVSFSKEILGQSSDVCQNGWTRYEESCYLVGFDLTLSYIESEHYCRQHDGHLIHVDSADENMFMVDWLHKTQAGYCWIGLTDMELEGKWLWYDTHNVPEYTHWYPGEPAGGDGEDCAVYAAHHPDYAWDDYPCSSKFHPICEVTPQISGIIG